jgi:hypothetical protein
MKKNILIGLISLIIFSTILLGFKSDNKAISANYTVIVAKELSELEQKVETKLRDGFQCTGGVASDKDFKNQIYYMQAMVK